MMTVANRFLTCTVLKHLIMNIPLFVMVYQVISYVICTHFHETLFMILYASVSSCRRTRKQTPVEPESTKNRQKNPPNFQVLIVFIPPKPGKTFFVKPILEVLFEGVPVHVLCLLLDYLRSLSISLCTSGSLKKNSHYHITFMRRGLKSPCIRFGTH